MELCHSCNKEFADYKELALHISSSKKGHRKGKRWAAKYLLRLRALSKRENNYGHSKLTEADKENKRSTIRKLSGESVFVEALCPHCKRKSRQNLPIEYAESKEAWRNKGCLVVLCQSCGG